MSTASGSNLDFVTERKNLEEKFTNLKRSIVGGIDGMESSKGKRDLRRKECVLKVMKMILSNLEAQDKEVMNELKSEAFDLMRVCDKFEAELAQLSSVSCSQLVTDIRDLDRKVDCLGIEPFVESLDLAVDSEPFDSASLMETMRDAIYLKTPSVSPRSFSLVLPEMGCPAPVWDILKLEVHVKQEGLSFNPFILKRLMFSVGFADLENCSLLSKMENKTGEISADGRVFSFWTRKRTNMTCRLSVKFLSSNISSSPQLLEAVEDVQSDSLQTGERLARIVSDGSSAGPDPPQKIPRLEEKCFKSPLTQAASSSAMEGKEHRPSKETAREDGSKVIIMTLYVCKAQSSVLSWRYLGAQSGGHGDHLGQVVTSAW